MGRKRNFILSATFYRHCISLNVLCKLFPFHLCLFFSSNQFRTQLWSFFQTLFSRICLDYCSAGLSSVTKTNQHGARRHQRKRTGHSNFGQQPWKHVIFHKEVSRVCGLGLERQLIIADLDCSFYRKKKKDNSLSKETSKCCQQRMRKKCSEERHTTDMATFFFFFFYFEH